MISAIKEENKAIFAQRLSELMKDKNLFNPALKSDRLFLLV